MKIDINNYEIYADEFISGTLNSLLMHEFTTFLENNPEIKEEFKSMEIFSLEKKSFNNLNKNNLYWKDSISNSKNNDLLIGTIENDLNQDQVHQLNQKLHSNQKLNQDLVLFKKTKLKADKSITFENKTSLYRKSIPPINTYLQIIVAASILLFFIFIVQEKPKQNSLIISKNELSFHKFELVELPKMTKGNTLVHNQKNNHNTKGNQKENLNKIRSKSKISSLTGNSQQLKKAETYNSLTDISSIQQNIIERNRRLLNFEDERKTFWLIAEKSIQKIGKLTNKNIQLKNSYSPDGEIARLVLSTENFKFERTFNIN